MASLVKATSSPSRAKKTAVGNSSASSPRRANSLGSGMGLGGKAFTVGGERDKDITTLVPPAELCSYAPCFCEENVWKLCAHIQARTPAPALTDASAAAPTATGSASSDAAANGGASGAAGARTSSELSKCHVVFVSNEKQVVPLWRQKAGKDEEKLVIWDYHAILVYKPDHRCIVFDLDSNMPFPTFFHKYVTETFRTDAILNPEYHRFFRVVPAATFLAEFASDRRHMKKPDGTWMKSPPPYPPIQTAKAKHNLDDFISMDPAVGVGQVMSLKEFVQQFFRK